MECKINRSSAAGEGPSSPDHNAELGVGGRGEKQLLSVWLVFGIDFHFLQLCFLEACLYEKYRNKREADLGGFLARLQKRWIFDS